VRLAPRRSSADTQRVPRGLAGARVPARAFQRRQVAPTDPPQSPRTGSDASAADCPTVSIVSTAAGAGLEDPGGHPPAPQSPGYGPRPELAAALLDPEAGGLEGHVGCAPCGWSGRTSRTVGSCLRCAVAPSLPPELPPRRGGSGVPGAPAAAPEQTKALVSELTRAFTAGVSDGARTRDTQDHNLVLYQLSYTHHVHPGRAREEPAQRYRSPRRAGPGRGSGVPHASAGGSSVCPASPAASSSAKPATTSSDAFFACELLGPGAATNRVRR
jgi:hypothetical protein